MNNQEILDNAPKGATHIDGEYDFCKDGSYFGYSSKQWIPSEFIVESRSLADIKRIAELENIPTQVFTRRPFRPNIDTEVKKLAYSKGFEDALKEVQYNIDKLEGQE